MQDLNTQKNEMGLSQTNRVFIVSLAVVILLIFGPIEPYGFIFRLAYLIILPTLLWLALRYWGFSWNIDSLTN